MRAGAAQPCQVRKEATVSGGMLRRDHPGKGAFILYARFLCLLCWLFFFSHFFSKLLDKKIKRRYYNIGRTIMPAKPAAKKTAAKKTTTKAKAKKTTKK